MADRSSPDSATLREVIAGIIDPDAKFQNIEGVQWSRFELQRREMAYQKANAILALIPARSSAGSVTIRRDWIEHVIKCLQGDLPSGRIGDAVFLLRDQLQDILDQHTSEKDK